MIAAGLVAGLALGLLAAALDLPWLTAFAIGIEPIGTIWMNLIRMCVIPLVISALVSGVAAVGDIRKLGRVGVRTLLLFAVTIIISSLIGLAVASLLIPLAPVSPESAAALRASAAAGAESVSSQAAQVQGIRQFLLNLVPANVVRAAYDGALLSLVVFSVLLGAAVGTLPDNHRGTIVGFMDALLAALIRLIGWIMLLAPIGVLCLAAPVAARFGWDTIRSLFMFVLSVVAGTTLAAVTLFALIARFMAKVPPGRFGRVITPGVAVAFTTASSLVALPTMMDTALRRLGLSKAVAGFVLPLSATINRPGSGIYQMCAVVLVASLYGIPLGPAQFAVALATSLAMTFSVASIPSATVFTTAPVLLAVGLPVEALALLLGVDRIPDMFRTGLHGVSHQTLAAVVARSEGEEITV